MNILGKIMDWEDGKLDEDQEAILFQQLVDSGLAWQLQGMYGRKAQSLLDAGVIVPKAIHHD